MKEQKTKTAAQPRRHTQLSEFINSGNGSCAMNVAGVVNKEREAEKGKSPLASPLKEKGEEKEISTVSVSDSARACAYAQGSASPEQSHLKAESVDIGNRVLRPDRRRLEKVDADFILCGIRFVVRMNEEEHEKATRHQTYRHAQSVDVFSHTVSL